MQYCQGTNCHEYKTKDRIRGTKGQKYYATRRRSKMYYGKGNFCSLNCQNDWWELHGDNAVDHSGRLTEPKHLTEENSWDKRENYYSWQRENNEPRYYYLNVLTREQRPLTESQYNDSTYTLNTGE